MLKSMILAAALLALFLPAASAQYQGWQHSGSLYILTTPEGANLPATASETDFPLLVRLNSDFFDFRQAKADGADIRFATSSGTPLAYEIDQWDPAHGTASIWVRIPTIKGNARQEIRMFWGKADAASQSSGAAVFNASNGYLSVWHMNNPVKDEVGTLQSQNTGTTSASGVIGNCRRFGPGKGINCGEKIAGYPTGSSPHSSEAWIRAEKPNATVLAWGNEEAQGKVVMQFVSPPHINMDCYFSAGNVASRGRLPIGEWIHVAHTYKNGESRLYVNGLLDGVRRAEGPPLAIKSPARMYIGGWYNNFNFTGEIDEVRVSKVTRSADWVRMEYENQKPLQTLVGPLVQPGNEFSVSLDNIAIDENRIATFTARAGGAEKIYWILDRDGLEKTVAVDRYSYTLEAGRDAEDTRCTLRFRAVYAHEVKTKDIAVTIKHTLPLPEFTLNAPKTWNGRETIEVVPVITNMEAMTARRVDKLHFIWVASGGAVIKQITSDRLVLKRSQYTGPIEVLVGIDNGGAMVVKTVQIQVTEPKTDPWVERTPEKDEKPEDNQFYARDDHNEGTLFYNGKLDQPADAVFLRLYADDRLLKTETQQIVADGTYALAVKLKAGLIKYRVEFGTKTDGREQVLHTARNLVCGDAFLIDGQSNALATDTGEKSPAETSEWIRSYGGPAGDTQGARPNLWCNPVWKAQKGEKAELGYWGMELAKRLVASQKMPIFIINAAVGGTRIDQHQRNETDPTDPSTIYGRMLWRVRQARLAHGIRAVIWHQGENDQGADGPGGGYGWETYQQYFLDMSAAWKQDFPNVRHYYVLQIWPNSCSMGNGHGDMLREVQRTLPRLYSNMDVMSTLGIKPAGGCHYPLTGWAEFARLLQPLIERDFYGKVPAAPITPPNLRRAYYTNSAKISIALEFDQAVVWKDSLSSQFYLDGVADKSVTGTVAGSVVTLKLPATSAARKITYLKEMNWSQDKLLVGANGIAALTFCDVPIEDPALRR
jgi:hypothetical protein